MEVLEKVISDWNFCQPREGVLPVERLTDAFGRAEARIFDSPASSQVKQDAFSLLESEGGDALGDFGHPPLLEQMLLRGLVTAGDKLDEQGSGVLGVTFLRFWQGWAELERRLRQEIPDGFDEPLAEEIAIFRDALLRHSRDAGIQFRTFWSEVVQARSMSADDEAWASIERVASRVCDSMPCTNNPLKAFAKVGTRNETVMDEEVVCAVLVPWFQELEEDYRQGPRAAKIKCVRDVCNCSRREACFALGSMSWDLEAAMMSHFGKLGGPPLGKSALRSWSSRGAKLRHSEVECPICMINYDPEEKPAVIKCCYQVLCESCHARLTTPLGAWPETELNCPFCRGVDKRSDGDLWHRARQHQLGAAGGNRSSASGGLGGQNQRLPGNLSGQVSDTFTTLRIEARRAIDDFVAIFREELPRPRPERPAPMQAQVPHGVAAPRAQVPRTPTPRAHALRVHAPRVQAQGTERERAQERPRARRGASAPSRRQARGSRAAPNGQPQNG